MLSTVDFVKSFAFGVTLAVAVGPIALLIINYGVTKGFRTAAAAGLGAALADFAYALIAFLLGSAALTAFTQFESALRFLSAITLILLGAYILLGAARSAKDSTPPPSVNRASGPLATTFMLTIINPLTIVVFASFSVQLPLTSSTWAALVFAFALYLGSLTVQLMYAAGGAVLAGLLSRRSWTRILNGVSGVVIATFGVLSMFELFAS